MRIFDSVRQSEGGFALRNGVAAPGRWPGVGSASNCCCGVSLQIVFRAPEDLERTPVHRHMLNDDRDLDDSSF